VLLLLLAALGPPVLKPNLQAQRSSEFTLWRHDGSVGMVGRPRTALPSYQRLVSIHELLFHTGEITVVSTLNEKT
jgi:hypothetical protein